MVLISNNSMEAYQYSVVIRCYNEEAHIGRLLCGLLEQTVKPKEIIIVDSGSNDATLSIASRYPVEIVSISKEEFSFGRALNAGCSRASSPFLIIVSAHVYPLYRNWAESILDPFLKDKMIGLVYGKQRGGECTYYSEHQIFKKWFPEQSTLNQEHHFCNNANAAIRRDLWKEIPYSHDLTGLEDLDWAKRVAKKGFKIAYQAEAEVIHIHNATAKDIYNRYYREAFALRRVCTEERFRRREFLHLLFLNLFNDFISAAREKKLFKNIKDIIIFRFMQFTGTYQGFNHKKEPLSMLKERFYYPHKEYTSGKDNKFPKELKINYSNKLP